MDKGIGEITAKLRELGIDKKTLVLFTSDNGQVVDLAPVASAGPYRGGKGDMYEGGHRVPFLAWWPGTITPGKTSAQTAMTVDLFPTFLDLAGLPMPAERPLDGISLKETLLTGKPLPHRLLFWDNVRQKAVRDGKWKLVIVNDPKKKIRANELYDLEADPGETKDLAASQPEIAARLSRELEKWSADVANGATPQPFYKKGRRDRQ
jgi:arylsulfatase A-like enzyme